MHPPIMSYRYVAVQLEGSYQLRSTSEQYAPWHFLPASIASREQIPLRSSLIFATRLNIEGHLQLGIEGLSQKEDKLKSFQASTHTKA